MLRPPATPVTRGFLPLALAPGAQPACVERVPDVAAAGIANPCVVLSGLPQALRTPDAQEPVVVVFADRRVPLEIEQQEENHVPEGLTPLLTRSPSAKTMMSVCRDYCGLRLTSMTLRNLMGFPFCSAGRYFH
jgi:hypothetical protein